MGAFGVRKNLSEMKPAVGGCDTLLQGMSRPDSARRVYELALSKGCVGDYNGVMNINLPLFIESVGLRLRYRDDLDDLLSGYIRVENAMWTIGINQKHAPTRQRFTMAHELGHYFLQINPAAMEGAELMAPPRESAGFKDTTFFRNTNLTAVERMANNFAAELLMPEDSLSRIIIGSSDRKGCDSVADLARLFQVSPLAMYYRLHNLGYKLVRSDA